ncbi:MAG: RNA 2',3'-cyclic phosphodiesterase [Phycisphaerales bacterium]
MRPRRESGPLRLFVAAYPPSGLAQSLVDAARSPELMDVRWTPASQVHLTLQFIGDTEDRDIPRVMESMERACAATRAFVLTFERLRTLPFGGEPKLIAATTDCPSYLTELHKRLALRLARNDAKRNAERFRPHVTLCRSVRTPHRLDLPLEPLRWTVDAVLLMASVLHPSGAEHRELCRVGLAASPGLRTLEGTHDAEPGRTRDPASDPQPEA